MNTKIRGNIAIGQAISYYLNNGYEVCLPIGDKRHYDFIVERNGKLERVQVKFAGLYKNNKCKAGLRITGGNQSYNYSRKYSDDAFNKLFVYTERGEKYLIPWGKVDCRNELTIEHVKYQKYKVD
ncbi:MAG: group I intron-associated PD-(D/E)XK endonuclease [Patescibacteria group bacterium]|nr:group I intron-associated PD-(D/E)XK endonuclease [Patescibacteria group bacterium]